MIYHNTGVNHIYHEIYMKLLFLVEMIHHNTNVNNIYHKIIILI